MTRSIRSDPGEGVVLRSDSANSIVQSNADSTQNVNIVMPSDSKNNIQNSNQNIPHSNSAGSVQPISDLPNDNFRLEEDIDSEIETTSHNYAPLRSFIQVLETVQEVFFWDGVQKPRPISLDVRSFFNIDNTFFSSLNSGLRFVPRIPG
ncbi:hypothetical protein TNCV_3582621 [Trichonephila clavipes]|nr:hypothetical protein TNCV_3582621 [Trichonephila clavipes]